ncbi:MAG: transglycosylase domain-containing protein [Christensenellales bacterium]
MSKVKKVLLTILAALIGVLLLFCAAFYVFFDVPDWQKLDISRLSALAQTSSMYDMNGELMSELRGSENRIIVSLDEIPLHTRQAFIAAEDLRFYDHRGIDVYRILGALRSNLKSGSLAEAQAPSHSSWPNSPISALKKRFAVSWRNQPRVSN